MNKKLIFAILGVVVLAGIGLLFVFKGNESADKQTQNLSQVSSQNQIKLTPEQKKVLESLPKAEPIQYTEEEKKYNYLINNYSKVFSGLKDKAPKCFGMDYEKFFYCFARQVDPEEVKDNLDSEYWNVVKEDYYKIFYNLAENLIKYPTTDPVALEIKKQKIKYWIENKRITSATTCDKLPEQEVREYCKGLLGK